MKEIKRTKTIEQLVGYEAFDGKIFKTEDECRNYEQSAYGVLRKGLEDLMVGESFNETMLFEDFGYGSEEYGLAVIEIKDEDDLFKVNHYYEFVNEVNGCHICHNPIGKEYIGKRVLINLGCEWDRAVPPNPRTEDELKECLERAIKTYFYPDKKGGLIMEDKQEILTAICEALRKTSNAGTGNALKEIRYIRKENGEEIARPIFEDGAGESGYYDIYVTGDSGTAMFIDVAKQFVKKMW